eukprot:2311547-Amphidinium_carterae.1
MERTTAPRQDTATRANRIVLAKPYLHAMQGCPGSLHRVPWCWSHLLQAQHAQKVAVKDVEEVVRLSDLEGAEYSLECSCSSPQAKTEDC